MIRETGRYLVKRVAWWALLGFLGLLGALISSGTVRATHEVALALPGVSETWEGNVVNRLTDTFDPVGDVVLEVTTTIDGPSYVGVACAGGAYASELGYRIAGTHTITTLDGETGCFVYMTSGSGYNAGWVTGAGVVSWAHAEPTATPTSTPTPGPTFPTELALAAEDRALLTASNELAEVGLVLFGFFGTALLVVTGLRR